MVGQSLGVWASDNIFLLIIIAGLFALLERSRIIKQHLGERAWYAYLVATFSTGCVITALIWFDVI